MTNKIYTTKSKNPCENCTVKPTEDNTAWCCCPAFTKWNNRQLRTSKLGEENK